MKIFHQKPKLVASLHLFPYNSDRYTTTIPPERLTLGEQDFLLEKEKLQRGLEDALKALTHKKDETLVRQIRPILLTNFERGRLQTFVDEDPARIQTYVWLVAQNFSKLNPYLHKLQIESDTETWAPLYEHMQTWAYNFFLRKGFHADEHTREIAIECATDAATIILKSHFPYDTDFDPWARIIVQNACRKYIHRSLKKSNVPEEKKVELEDELNDPQEPLLETNALQNEKRDEIIKALNQLSEGRRTVIQLIFFEELSPEEVAQRMDKTVGAIYTLQFHALRDLRKILNTNRDISNE